MSWSNWAVGLAVASRLAMREVASCRAIGSLGINLWTMSSSWQGEKREKVSQREWIVPKTPHHCISINETNFATTLETTWGLRRQTANVPGQDEKF